MYFYCLTSTVKIVPKMNTTDENVRFPLGSRVFAKMKGFPAWPAQITENLEHPKAKSSRSKRQQFVRFYHTNDVAWVAEQDLETFDEKVEDYKQTAALKAGRQSNDLRQAIAEAEADKDVHGPTVDVARTAESPNGENISHTTSQILPQSSSEQEHPGNGQPMDVDSSSISKLAPLRAMQELTPNTASSTVATPSRRVTLTITKDSTGKGGLQTVTDGGGPSKGMIKQSRLDSKRSIISTSASGRASDSAAGAPKRSRTSDDKPASTTRGSNQSTAAKQPHQSPRIDSVWSSASTVVEVGGRNMMRGGIMPHSLAAEHQTGITMRYGFFGLGSNAMLRTIVEKMMSASGRVSKSTSQPKVAVNVYMPVSFDHLQAHQRTASRSVVHEVKSVDVLFNESEVVFLAPPTEADLRSLFEGEETHQLRRCAKAGGTTKAIVLFGLFDPFYVKHVADLMSGKQIDILELVPTGGETNGPSNGSNVQQGEIVFCASGNADVIRRIGDFFNAAGRTVVNTGANIGSAGNLGGLYATFEAITTTALVEVLHDAKHLGVSQARLLELIAAKGAASTACTSQAHTCISDPLSDDGQIVTNLLDERFNVMRRILAPHRAQEFMLNQAHCVVRNMFAVFQPGRDAVNHDNNKVMRAMANNTAVLLSATAAPATTVTARPVPQHKHGTRAAAAAVGGPIDGNGSASSSSSSSSIVSSFGGSNDVPTTLTPGSEHRGRGRPRKNLQQLSTCSVAAPVLAVMNAGVASVQKEVGEPVGQPQSSEIASDSHKVIDMVVDEALSGKTVFYDATDDAATVGCRKINGDFDTARRDAADKRLGHVASTDGRLPC